MHPTMHRITIQTLALKSCFRLFQKWNARSITLLLLLTSNSAFGQYRPLEIPKTWTFNQATPAYAEPEKQTHLGDRGSVSR